MYNNNQPDQDTAFTAVVSIVGGYSEHPLFMKLRPFALSNDLTGHSKITNPTHFMSVVTQLIITNLGEADDSSKNQQLGRFTWKGKNKTWPVKPVQDQIAAEVISQIWDRVCGKLEGSSFTYKSNKLQFSAVFDSQKNKYLIYPERRA